jgi:hypothetical protein
MICGASLGHLALQVMYNEAESLPNNMGLKKNDIGNILRNTLENKQKQPP